MSIVTVENLKKYYTVYDQETRALDGVSFEVEKGQFVAIIGTSGSGKSTLLHLLGGVDTPTDGRVIIDGTDMYALSQKDLAAFRRRRIALIYQFYNLLPMLNVRANILGGGKAGQAGALRHGIARALLVLDENVKQVLKDNGMLTRDSREKERKKPGQPGARRRFQFSKR